MTPSIEETRAALQELPGLAALLPIALTTGPAPQNGTAHPAPASRIPIRLDVIQLLDMRNTRPERMEWADPDGHGVVPYLDGWVVDIADDLEATTPDPHPLPEPQLAAITAWLAERLTLIAGLPQWPDFADGVHRIRHATRQAVAHLANPTPAVSHPMPMRHAIPTRRRTHLDLPNMPSHPHHPRHQPRRRSPRTRLAETHPPTLGRRPGLAVRVSRRHTGLRPVNHRRRRRRCTARARRPAS